MVKLKQCINRIIKNKNLLKGISTLIGTGILNFIMGAVYSLSTLAVYEISYIKGRGGLIDIFHLTFYWPVEMIFQCISSFFSGSVYKKIGLHLTDLIGGIILLLGYVAYGLSIFTYIRAQKNLGAARTSSYYALAPFIGVALSAIFLKERLTLLFIVALVIMIAGTVIIIYDTLLHSHRHAHTHVITHTHDGTTHTHVIEHTHEHNHVISENKHGHTHSIDELELYLKHEMV